MGVVTRGRGLGNRGARGLLPQEGSPGTVTGWTSLNWDLEAVVTYTYALAFWLSP